MKINAINANLGCSIVEVPTELTYLARYISADGVSSRTTGGFDVNDDANFPTAVVPFSSTDAATSRRLSLNHNDASNITIISATNNKVSDMLPLKVNGIKANKMVVRGEFSYALDWYGIAFYDTQGQEVGYVNAQFSEIISKANGCGYNGIRTFTKGNQDASLQIPTNAKYFRFCFRYASAQYYSEPDLLQGYAKLYYDPSIA